MDYGGDEVLEDENDNDVKAQKFWEETRTSRVSGKCKRTESLAPSPLSNSKPMVNGVNGHIVANGQIKPTIKSKEGGMHDVSESATGPEGAALP